MAGSLDFIQAQLQSIQTELREMKFAAEVDRRNARSHYDNLVVEVGGAIGKIDAKAEMLAEHLEERLDSMEGRLDNFSEQLGGRVDNLAEHLEGRVGNLGEQLGERLNSIDAMLKRLIGGAWVSTLGPDLLALEGDVGDHENHDRRRDEAGQLGPDQQEAL
jgi:DNA anti-recombination protein RmuC